MKSLMTRLFRSAPARRSVSRSSICAIDSYEDRTLLSGVAIYPQPAAVSPAADPPADFSGTWNISSPQGDGTAEITQNGADAQVALSFGGFVFNTDAKVKGNVAKAKINETIGGFAIKGKMTTTLLEPGAFEGTAKIKKSPIGKITLDFTGSLDT